MIVNNELERMKREEFVAEFHALSRHPRVGTKENHQNLS